MEIVFDPKKDTANRKKHRISLSRADDFDFDNAFYSFDDREDYGELRYEAIEFPMPGSTHWYSRTPTTAICGRLA